MKQLRHEVQARGVVPVTVHLTSASFGDLQGDKRVALQQRIAVLKRALDEQLGPDALRNGRWDNGAGQIGVVVNARGLEALIASDRALSLHLAENWREANFLYRSDDAFDIIESALQQQGYAWVRVLLNIEGLSLVLPADGSARPQALATDLERGLAGFHRQLAEALDSEVLNRQALLQDWAARSRQGAAALTGDQAWVTLQVTREGLLKLAGSEWVRDIRPFNHQDRRPLHADDTWLLNLARQGAVDVVLTLRHPYFGGRLSPASRQALAHSNRAAFRDILADITTDRWQSDISSFGAVVVRLAPDQLRALLAKKDARLLSIVPNQLMGRPQMTVAHDATNLDGSLFAEPEGYMGVGQYVVIMDTGIQASHPFLTVPTNRVYPTAWCFGTNGNVAATPGGPAVSAQSLCPLGVSSGSGPVAIWGAPQQGSPHGTRMAGVAVGRGPMSRVGSSRTYAFSPAPAAVAISVPIYSKEATSGDLRFSSGDLLAALQLLGNELNAQSTSTGVLIRPYTVNLSAAADYFQAACSSSAFSAFVTAVSSLRSFGVPVVAAMGNDAFNDGMGFPACLPGVVKVAASTNDGTGNTRGVFQDPVISPNTQQRSNLVSLATLAQPNHPFFGETFWLAPGGGVRWPQGTGPFNAVFAPTTSSGLGYSGGTSQAAAHISGLYAAAKGAQPGWTVAEITAYFTAVHSVCIPTPHAVEGDLLKGWRRIQLGRAPALGC